MRGGALQLNVSSHGGECAILKTKTHYSHHCRACGEAGCSSPPEPCSGSAAAAERRPSGGRAAASGARTPPPAARRRAVNTTSVLTVIDSDVTRLHRLLQRAARLFVESLLILSESPFQITPLFETALPRALSNTRSNCEGDKMKGSGDKQTDGDVVLVEVRWQNILMFLLVQNVVMICD